SADLGIAGTWDAPRLRGERQIANAAATIPTLSVRYEDIDGRLTLSGDTITIQSLSARSERGRADFTGIVRLEQLTHPVLDLRIAADQFKALDLKSNVAITASGRLSLKGPVFGATLTGHAEVTSGGLYFGTPDQDAALDIKAKHVVHPVPTPALHNPEDITVVAHIGGTLLVPKVTLEAEKRELSQTEIISYLLFGKSSVDLAGDQGGIA